MAACVLGQETEIDIIAGSIIWCRYVPNTTWFRPATGHEIKCNHSANGLYTCTDYAGKPLVCDLSTDTAFAPPLPTTTSSVTPLAAPRENFRLPPGVPLKLDNRPCWDLSTLSVLSPGDIKWDTSLKCTLYGCGQLVCWSDEAEWDFSFACSMENPSQ